MNFVEDLFIQNLPARLNQPGVVGLAIAGSYSRGAQNQHSDVDVDIFMESLPDETYTLRLMDGKLVSLKYLLVRDEYASLTKPEKAIWAVPGLRQMQILLDETGELAKLKQAAFDFNWVELQTAANEFAVDNLMGCAEEAQKIIGGLLQENESKVLYASWGMFKGLSFAAAVQAGLMIESENRIFAIMQDHFENDHAWTRAFRLSFGMDVGDMSVPVYQTRGEAALDLYEQTALLFEKIINDKHREVIENALQVISSYKQGHLHA
jgi:predicted nucleotidyltransferase